MSIMYPRKVTDCSAVRIHEQQKFIGEHANLTPSTSRETKL